eukprot:Nk52_evm4s323 gene=Nk52_evmTU4s323
MSRWKTQVLLIVALFCVCFTLSVCEGKEGEKHEGGNDMMSHNERLYEDDVEYLANMGSADAYYLAPELNNQYTPLMSTPAGVMQSPQSQLVLNLIQMKKHQELVNSGVVSMAPQQGAGKRFFTHEEVVRMIKGRGGGAEVDEHWSNALMMVLNADNPTVVALVMCEEVKALNMVLGKAVTRVRDENALLRNKFFDDMARVKEEYKSHGNSKMAMKRLRGLLEAMENQRQAQEEDKSVERVEKKKSYSIDNIQENENLKQLVQIILSTSNPLVAAVALLEHHLKQTRELREKRVSLLGHRNEIQEMHIQEVKEMMREIEALETQRKVNRPYNYYKEDCGDAKSFCMENVNTYLQPYESNDGMTKELIELEKHYSYRSFPLEITNNTLLKEDATVKNLLDAFSEKALKKDPNGYTYTWSNRAYINTIRPISSFEMVTAEDCKNDEKPSSLYLGIVLRTSTHDLPVCIKPCLKGWKRRKKGVGYLCTCEATEKKCVDFGETDNCSSHQMEFSLGPDENNAICIPMRFMALARIRSVEISYRGGGCAIQKEEKQRIHPYGDPFADKNWYMVSFDVGGLSLGIVRNLLPNIFEAFYRSTEGHNAKGPFESIWAGSKMYGSIDIDLKYLCQDVIVRALSIVEKFKVLDLATRGLAIDSLSPEHFYPVVNAKEDYVSATLRNAWLIWNDILAESSNNMVSFLTEMSEMKPNIARLLRIMINENPDTNGGKRNFGLYLLKDEAGGSLEIVLADPNGGSGRCKHFFCAAGLKSVYRVVEKGATNYVEEHLLRFDIAQRLTSKTLEPIFGKKELFSSFQSIAKVVNLSQIRHFKTELPHDYPRADSDAMLCQEFVSDYRQKLPWTLGCVERYQNGSSTCVLTNDSMNRFFIKRDVVSCSILKSGESQTMVRTCSNGLPVINDSCSPICRTNVEYFPFHCLDKTTNVFVDVPIPARAHPCFDARRSSLDKGIQFIPTVSCTVSAKTGYCESSKCESYVAELPEGDVLKDDLLEYFLTADFLNPTREYKECKNEVVYSISNEMKKKITDLRLATFPLAQCLLPSTVVPNCGQYPSFIKLSDEKPPRFGIFRFLYRMLRVAKPHFRDDPLPSIMTRHPDYKVTCDSCDALSTEIQTEVPFRCVHRESIASCANYKDHVEGSSINFLECKTCLPDYSLKNGVCLKTNGDCHPEDTMDLFLKDGRYFEAPKFGPSCADNCVILKVCKQCASGYERVIKQKGDNVWTVVRQNDPDVKRVISMLVKHDGGVLEADMPSKFLNSQCVYRRERCAIYQDFDPAQKAQKQQAPKCIKCSDTYSSELANPLSLSKEVVCLRKCSSGVDFNIEDYHNNAGKDVPTQPYGCRAVDIKCENVCPAGSGCNHASGHCELCKKGLYSDESSVDACKKCGNYFTTTDKGSKSEKECKCLFEASSANECFCPFGHFIVDNGTALVCEPCPINYFNDDQKNSKNCKVCDLIHKFYSNQIGASHCDICKKNEILDFNSLDGIPYCRPCSEGSFPKLEDENSPTKKSWWKCELCSAGHFLYTTNDASGPECMSCPSQPPKYSISGSTECSDCFPKFSTISLSTEGIYACSIGVSTGSKVLCWRQFKSPPGEPEFKLEDQTSLVLKKVSVGMKHACGIDANDAVHCWGDDAYGQSTGDWGKFKMVSSGASHTCGILAGTGSAVCWGREDLCQVPKISIEKKYNFVDLSSSTEGTCGIVKSGDKSSIVCWPSETISLSGLEEEEFTQISFHNSRICALGITGSMKCWSKRPVTDAGSTSEFALEENKYTDISFVSVGPYHFCAIKNPPSPAKTSVQCWLNNIAKDSLEDHGLELVMPDDHIPESVYVSKTNVCSLSSTKRILCYAFDTSDFSFLPAQLTREPNCYPDVSNNAFYLKRTSSPHLYRDYEFKSVSAGALHTCVILQSDTVACWGLEGAPSISNTPSRDIKFKSISSGYLHVCGITFDHKVQCWALFANDQPDKDILVANTPRNELFRSVSVTPVDSKDRPCACGFRLESNVIQCWGTDSQTRIDYKYAPASHITAGFTPIYSTEYIYHIYYVCSLSATSEQASHDKGEVSCHLWGEYTQNSTPGQSKSIATIQVSPSRGPIFKGLLSNSKGSICGVSEEGNLLCLQIVLSKDWSPEPLFEFAEFGADASSPFSFQSVSMGDEHICALTTAGNPHCWGSNTYGQTEMLGIGWNKFISISAGYRHTCGIVEEANSTKETGSLICWGMGQEYMKYAAAKAIQCNTT